MIENSPQRHPRKPTSTPTSHTYLGHICIRGLSWENLSKQPFSITVLHLTVIRIISLGYIDGMQEVSLLICVRALQIHKEFFPVLLCASRYKRNFSQCFCVLLCVAKVRWKFQTQFGVWYTLQMYIKINRSSGPCYYPVYANNGRDLRLAKIFLGSNDVRQKIHPVVPGFFFCSQFVPMKFSLCFHQICKFSICSSSFQSVPQLVPNSSHFMPYPVPSVLLLSHTQRSPKDEITIYHICFRNVQNLI